MSIMTPQSNRDLITPDQRDKVRKFRLFLRRVVTGAGIAIAMYAFYLAFQHMPEAFGKLGGEAGWREHFGDPAMTNPALLYFCSASHDCQKALLTIWLYEIPVRTFVVYGVGLAVASSAFFIKLEGVSSKDPGQSKWCEDKELKERGYELWTP